MINESILQQKLKTLTPAERLRSIRTQLRHSRNYICQTYKLPIDTLRAWENGKVRLTEKAITRCLSIYRKEGVILSKSWIVTGEGLPPKLAVEIGNFFESDNQKQNLEMDDTLLMVKEADFFKNLNPDSTILLVTTEEMLPYYAPGDYVGGRLKSKTDIDDCIGKDCIVISKSQKKYFRRLSKNILDGSYNLVCHNPHWGKTLEPVIFDVDIESVAPIIWHRRLN